MTGGGRSTLTALAVAAAFGLATPGVAAPGIEAALAEAEYAAGGEEVCLECHDETEEYPVLSILKTPHAARADRRTPFAGHSCQSCHGPSAAHVEDNDVLTPIRFGPEAPAGPQNEVCLGCHQRGVGMHWIGGAHQAEGLSCSSCHTLHVGSRAQGDPILSKNSSRRRSPSAQSKTCFQCHKQQRALAYRISAHPIRYGQIECSDCHNPHGAAGPMQLAKPTLNETCYRCHAEKRGPFLWEHAPAREDCSTCHTPHGSNHRSLLKARGPWLCQNCHLANFHPSAVYGANLGGGLLVLGGGDTSKLFAANCLNCHPEVHGSNHPSGPRLTR